MTPTPTKAQGFSLPKRQPVPVCADSWWQKYSTGPREDGQLEAEAQVRALKGTPVLLLQDWTSPA